LHGDFDSQAGHLNVDLSFSNSARSFLFLLENDNGEAEGLVALSIDRDAASLDLSELLVHGQLDVLLGNTVGDVAELASVRVNFLNVAFRLFFSRLLFHNFLNVEGSLLDRGLSSTDRGVLLLSGFLLDSFDLCLDFLDVFRLASGGLLLRLSGLVLGSEISLLHLHFVVGMPDVITLDHRESAVSSLGFEATSNTVFRDRSGLAFEVALGHVSLVDQSSSQENLLDDVGTSVLESDSSAGMLIGFMGVLIFKSVGPLEESLLFVSLH